MSAFLSSTHKEKTIKYSDTFSGINGDNVSLHYIAVKVEAHLQHNCKSKLDI